MALGFGMPAILLYVATSFFLEGIGRPVPGMVIIIGANVLNVILNWLLIFGHGGFPALGAEGAAIASSIVRWCMFAAAALYVLRFVHRRRFGITAAADRSRTHLGRAHAPNRAADEYSRTDWKRARSR